MRTREIPERTSLFLSVVVLASTVVLAVAPSAQATTNVLPNPGFESTCPGPSCGWTPQVGATIATDTSTKNSGTASLKVSGAAQATLYVKTCVALSPGTHEISYHYLAPDANTVSLRTENDFFSMAGCDPLAYISSAAAIFGATVGSWALQTGMITAPPTTASAQVSLVFSCNPNACSANFDDVDVESEILAVTISSLRAVRSHRGVALRWRTGTEVDELGFNVYRQQGNRRVRVNRQLLPAFGAVAGASYSFTDRHAPRHRALRYWLQDVDLTGARTWHGPVRVAAS